VNNAHSVPRGDEDTERSHGFALDNSLRSYGVDKWGQEFISVNDDGHLVFAAPGVPPLDLQDLVETLASRGISTPFVVRFPSMIEEQMRRLHAAFDKAGRENKFTAGHVGIYPLKVNQRRSVVDTVVAARETCNYGLEAGSKPELLLAMAQPVLPGVPLICNGFKDHEFMRLAFHAAELGHRVVIVMESVPEIDRYLQVAQAMEWQSEPELGMRAKLYSRGSGKWQSSGGERAKFGLTTPEMLEVVRRTAVGGRLDNFTLLHFHIGSQITQIKRIKRAVREGVRLWGALKQRCPNLQFLDLGGGIGVDYDGSRTSYPSSANYTVEEYASQVVFEIVEVVEAMDVPQPTIVTESGRVLVASHAVTVAELREVQGELLPLADQSEDEHRLIDELRYTLDHIQIKNIEEYFHDAIDFRDEALQLFSQGYLTLSDRAKAEGLFDRVRLRCAKLIGQMTSPPEEIEEYLDRAQHKYLANFSIFQSLPDAWSIDHVFPAAPLSGHGKRPTVNAQVVDITCDSDGCMTQFAHPDENLRELPLHVRGDDDPPYFLAFFMTGAYQDSLANRHNLFSRCHEVIVRKLDADAVIPGSEWIDLPGHALEVKGGLTNEDVLEVMDFDVESMTQLLRDRHLEVDTTLGQPWALGLLQGYPYLS
jgi:arginine decarboxylase